MSLSRHTIRCLLEDEFDRLSRCELKRITRDLDAIRYKIEKQDALLRDLKSVLVEVLKQETVPDFFWRIPPELKLPNVQLPWDEEDWQVSDTQPSVPSVDMQGANASSLQDVDGIEMTPSRMASLLNFEEPEARYSQLNPDSHEWNSDAIDDLESDSSSAERREYTNPLMKVAIIAGIYSILLILVGSVIGWLLHPSL